MTTIIISSRELLNKCYNLARVINSKNSLPILDNLRFEVDGCKLHITASDSEHFAIAHIELQDELANHVFGVNARTMVTALKELPEQPLTLEIDNTTCTVHYNNGHFNMPLAESILEYPMFPKMHETSSLTISVESLKRIFSKAPIFAASDELRPVMNGICFNFDDKLEAVASDGHALIKMIENCTHEGNGSFIMSLKTAKLAEAFIGKDDEQITIGHNRTHSYIKFAEYELYSRMIEGKYPNYNSVIPQNYTDFIEFNRADLLYSVKRVGVFSNAASQLLKFTISGFELNVKGEDVDFYTKAEETLMVDKVGNDLKIGFKAGLTQTILSSFTDERLRMKYLDGTRATLFSPADADESDHSMIVIQMPMMLND